MVVQVVGSWLREPEGTHDFMPVEVAARGSGIGLADKEVGGLDVHVHDFLLVQLLQAGQHVVQAEHHIGVLERNAATTRSQTREVWHHQNTS